MAKKTQQKKKKKPSTDRRVARRADRWRRRLDILDVWVDRLDHDKLASGVPYSHADCKAEYLARLKKLGSDDAPTVQEYRRTWLRDQLWRLQLDLRSAANRLALLPGYSARDCEPLAALEWRLNRSNPLAPRGKWTKAKDAELLAGVIAMFRRLLDQDGAASGTSGASRKPSPLEAAILAALLKADGSLSAKEIAALVQRSIQRSTTPQAVLAAMGKLRRDCGFPDLKATDAGFKLSPAYRVFAARIAQR